MGGKPRKTPPRKRTYEELEEVTRELAGCVIFALNHLKGSGMRFYQEKDGKHGVVIPWPDTFMDALDKIGYVVDRKAFREGRKTHR